MIFDFFTSSPHLLISYHKIYQIASALGICTPLFYLLSCFFLISSIPISATLLNFFILCVLLYAFITFSIILLFLYNYPRPSFISSVLILKSFFIIIFIFLLPSFNYFFNPSNFLSKSSLIYTSIIRQFYFHPLILPITISLLLFQFLMPLVPHSFLSINILSIVLSILFFLVTYCTFQLFDKLFFTFRHSILSSHVSV